MGIGIKEQKLFMEKGIVLLEQIYLKPMNWRKNNG